MSFASAIPDLNPTRTQLRLVVLGQWIRAGLALARGSGTGRGFVGGAVALWQVFQAVRLAILLAQRLSELRDVLSRTAPETAPGETVADDAAAWSEEAPSAAWLRDALTELDGTIRVALGRAPYRRARSGADPAVGPATASEVAPVVDRVTPSREPPPDPERWRRPWPAGVLKTALTPFAALATGRFRLAAG